MNHWITLAIIAAIVWFIAMPVLGIPAVLTLPSILFLFGILLVLKWIPQTSHFVTAIPLSRNIAGILALVIFAAGIFYMGWFASTLSVFNIGGITNSNTGVNIGGGTLSGKTTMTVIFTNKLTGAAAGVTSYAYRLKGMQGWTTGTATSASIDCNPGDKIEFVTSPVNATFYGSISDITCPNSYAPRVETYVDSIASATTGTVKSVVYNTDGSVMSATSPTTVSASDKDVFPFRITGSYQTTVGDEYATSTGTGGQASKDVQNIMSCKYNTTVISGFQIQNANGGNYPTAATPIVLPTTSGFAYVSAYVPQIVSNSMQYGQLNVQYTTVVPEAKSGNITCYVSGTGLYLDANTNNYVFGTTDQANAQVTGSFKANEVNFTVYNK